MTEYTGGVAKADPSNQKPQGGYDQWLMDQLIVIGERIASLESELNHHATKNDISNAKIWFITTSIGAVIAVTALVFTVLRYLGAD